ncbi:putative ferric-chelate reductase 1 [Brienomyrus brachyistius]|uniref:putative ferric-chelate reductase 1 n=1 Tax=Brienomyrus brachyistius TaxID=42636 RepID=UPI0020B190D3|nr:putative ferric-chelate reductase 1 [Brienomyrus brachyistius]XP_048845349.1 putative ferric-chelate reductase 1 [Brienomyrus brachyistius]
MSAGMQSALLLVAAACIVGVEGFPNGQVAVACSSMMPNHGQVASSSPSPYTVTVDKTTFSPGDKIKVTLSSSTTFKGFLIQARDSKQLSGNPVGTFTLLSSTQSQLLNCGSTQGSAVSQTSSARLNQIQVTWNAPKTAPSTVQFLATVVQSYSVFWVKVPSQVVSLTGGSPQAPTPVPGMTITTASMLPAPFSAAGCGSTTSCLRDPVGCDPQSDPQCFYLSFASIGQAVQFQLSGPAQGYMSFALSLDQWMGNDDVYLCVQNGNLVDISAAYATGRTYPEPASMAVLSNTAWRLSNGVIQCSFLRNISIPADQTRFNLNESYYIFIANGRADLGAIYQHDRQPLVSNGLKSITGSPENLSGSRSSLLVKFHGALMLIAWLTTVTTGIIVARFFKAEWPSSTLFGQKVWFQMHRGLMMLTVLLSCIGFILPFIYRKGWSEDAGAHPYLGCIVMGLAILQPVGATCRPHPTAPRRFIFNWLHFGGGITTQILAVATIFLGVQQQALLLPTASANGVLAGVVCWAALTGLVLELHRRGLIKFGKESSMYEGRLSPESKGNLFKKLVLIGFLAGNLAFIVTLLYLISRV